MGGHTVKRITEMEAILHGSLRRTGAERPEPFKLGAPDPTVSA